MPIVYTLLSNLFCMLIWVCCKRLMKHLIKKSKHKIQKRTSPMGELLLIEFVARNKWRQARMACFNRYSASGALSWPISSPKISLDCPGLNTKKQTTKANTNTKKNKKQKQIQIQKQKQIQIQIQKSIQLQITANFQWPSAWLNKMMLLLILEST